MTKSVLAMFILTCLPCRGDPPGLATLSGRVLDATSLLPLEKAQVVFACEPGRAPLLTDANGYFQAAIPGGAVCLSAMHSGYVPSDEIHTELPPGASRSRNFTLKALWIITGTVTDPDTGSAISALVLAFVVDSVAGLRRYSYAGSAVVSGKSGRFEISNLNPGDYVVEAIPPPNLSFSSSFRKSSFEHRTTSYHGGPRSASATALTLGSPETNFTMFRVRAPSLRRLEGLIKMPDSAAPQNVSVEVGNVSDSFFNATIYSTHSHKGVVNLRLDNLSEGTYRITVATTGPSENRLFGESWIRVTDKNIDDFEMILQPAATVMGKIRMLEEDMVLPQGLQVELTRRSYSALYPADLIDRSKPLPVNSDSFETLLRPGDYWPALKGLPPDYAVARIECNGSDISNSTVPINGVVLMTFLVTSRPGSVTSVVIDKDNVPLPNSLVALVPDSFTEDFHPRALWTGKSSANGRITFTGVPPGKYRMIPFTGFETRYLDDMAVVSAKLSGATAFEITAGQTTMGPPIPTAAPSQH